MASVKSSDTSATSVSSNSIKKEISKILDKEQLISSITSVLSDIIKENENESMLIEERKEEEKITKTKIDIFSGKKAPSITIEKFLQRILKYTKAEESTMILSLIYLDRFVEFNPNLKLTNLNIHRFILTSTIIAIKYNEDNHYANEFYSKVGGVSISELHSLELTFVKGIDYRLFVNENDYKNYEFCLKKIVKDA